MLISIFGGILLLPAVFGVGFLTDKVYKRTGSIPITLIILVIATVLFMVWMWLIFAWFPTVIHQTQQDILEAIKNMQ